MTGPDSTGELAADIAAINRIAAVPTILDIVSRTTGMGFVTIARVTEDRWVACCVKDDIAFGLLAGGELQVETTICDEIRQTGETVVINSVADDPIYCGHPAPSRYGFQSYISTPILRRDGRFFGTLCAIDPRPAQLKSPEIIGMFSLFAELIAFHLDALERLAATEARLLDEQRTAELREQFIAVLGHDLRNPLTAISAGADLLAATPLPEKASRIVSLVRASVGRMASLIDDVMDFARGRLGGGVTLDRTLNEPLEPALLQVIAELQAGFVDRTIAVAITLDLPVVCDCGRIAQVLSNLLGNALTYGATAQPVRVKASTDQEFFEMSVANGGDPVPPEVMALMFQPFSRGDVRSNQQGLGLGLFIASEIARAHGGTLTVASTTDETCFTFRMPRGVAPSGQALPLPVD